MYYPKKGYTGNHRKTVSPQVVQLALNETYRNPGWEYMDHNLMRLTIIRIEVEMRIAGTFQNKTEPKAKPQAKAKPTPRPQRGVSPAARAQSAGPQAKSQSSGTLPRFGNIHLPSVDPPDSETSFEKVDRISIDSEDKHIDIKGTRSEEMKHERKKMNSDMAQIRKEKDKIAEAARFATTTGRSNSSQPSSADYGSSLAWT
jgi:hypothetical protein